jgi:hypothetical protein
MTDKIKKKQEKSMKKGGRMDALSGSKALLLRANGTLFCTMNFVWVDDLTLASVKYMNDSQ